MCVNALPVAEAEQLFYALSQCKALEEADIRVREATKRQFRKQLFDGDQTTPLFHRSCEVPHLPRQRPSSGNHVKLTAHPLSEIEEPEIWSPSMSSHKLHLNMDVVKIDIAGPSDSFRHASLRELHVGCSHISEVEVESVIGIIFVAFPMFPNIVIPLDMGRRSCCLAPRGQPSVIRREREWKFYIWIGCTNPREFIF